MVLIAAVFMASKEEMMSRNANEIYNTAVDVFKRKNSVSVR